jgi:dephospho-CoA kinase
LAGGIATGKSTLARELVRRFAGSTVRAFGDVVRRKAAQDGRGQDRATLQEIGLQLIADGWPTFVDLLLADIQPVHDSTLIIDGIRHVEAIAEIRRRFPTTPVRVVFMRLDALTTEARLIVRDGGVEGLEHTVEADVWRIEQMADLIIDARQSIEESIASVSRVVETEKHA